jgi:Xaa-Pro dipeptidase
MQWPQVGRGMGKFLSFSPCRFLLLTAAELYAHAQKMAAQAGWEYGGPIARHLIGVFPLEKIAGDKVTLYVHPENRDRMRTPDALGRDRYWILGIRFVDRARQLGGFYEELLTIG